MLRDRDVQLTTQPPDLLLGQTGLGHRPSVMISLTSVISWRQADSDGLKFGQNLTKMRYSFPQTGQS